MYDFLLLFSSFLFYTFIFSPTHSLVRSLPSFLASPPCFPPSVFLIYQFRRARPLLLVPIFGNTSADETVCRRNVLAWLEALEALEKRILLEKDDKGLGHGFDVGLVLGSSHLFAIAHLERHHLRNGRRAKDTTTTTTTTTTPCARKSQVEGNRALQLSMRNLAQQAANGSLVLFLGAGVSYNAGLPLWSGLIKQIAKDAGLTDIEQKALAGTHRARTRILCSCFIMSFLLKCTDITDIPMRYDTIQYNTTQGSITSMLPQYSRTAWGAQKSLARPSLSFSVCAIIVRCSTRC